MFKALHYQLKRALSVDPMVMRVDPKEITAMIIESAKKGIPLEVVQKALMEPIH